MPPRPDDLPRFTRTETWVHRLTAVLVAVLTVTGAVLYVESLSLLVGRRALVEGVHVVAGLLLPLPTVVGLWTSIELRADVRRLGRFGDGDGEWLRTRGRIADRVGKFNAGQKLASAAIAGAGLVLLLTGLLLIAPARFDVPVGVREGATVTHDLFTFGVLTLLLGHVVMASRHPEARRALRTGAVDRAYAEQRHPAWVGRVDAGR